MEKKIYFNAGDRNISLPAKRKLSQFLEQQVIKAGKVLAGLSFTFLSDKELRKMNNKHLGHDYETDIITFDLSGSKSELLGDIYISIDRVKENAKEYSTTQIKELHRVIFHGLLHLLGSNDKTPSQREQMRKAEDNLLNRYFN